MDTNKRDKKIDRMVKVNYNINTKGIGKVLKIQLSISVIISSFGFLTNYHMYNGVFDVLKRFLPTTFAYFMLVAIFTTFPLMLVFSCWRGAISRVYYIPRFSNENPYDEYRIDYITYLLENETITESEYNRYIKNNPYLDYLINTKGYKPKKVWFDK